MLSRVVALLAVFLPQVVYSQATRVEWEIGGFPVALGDGQQQTIQKLSSVYSMVFDQDNDAFMVRCIANGRPGVSIGAVQFQKSRVTKIYTFEDVNCSDTKSVMASEALDIYTSIIKMLRKVQSRVKAPCLIDEPAIGLEAGAWLQCGPYHQVQFMGDKAKNSYGLLVTVQRR